MKHLMKKNKAMSVEAYAATLSHGCDPVQCAMICAQQQTGQSATSATGGAA